MEYRDVTSRLYQMAEAITGRLLIKDLTKRAVEVCKDIMRADACSIFLIDDKEPDRLIMKASSGYKKDLTNKAEYMLQRVKPDEKLGVTACIAIEGKTFTTKTREDFQDCPEYLGKYDEELWGEKDKLRCESFFGAPLKTCDRILGVLKVESSQKNHFLKEHKDMLQIIASMITSSIQNLKYLMVIESLGSLFEFIAKYPTDTRKLYDHFVRSCVELVPAEACSIFIPNEKGRLVLRGDYGHEISLVDNEDDDYTYASGEGVTGTVFQTGEPSSVGSKEEVKSHPKHESKLYPKQWKKEHVCHSWYQYPIGKRSPFLGVMKIENKLGIDRKPIEEGGFNGSEQQILKILANAVVPTIIAQEERLDKDRALRALLSTGHTLNIDEVFSPDLLEKIKELDND